MSLSTRQIFTRISLGVGTLAVLVLLRSLLVSNNSASAETDFRTATAVNGKFSKTILKQGLIKPVKEEHVVCKLWGKIVEIAAQGRVVAKDEVVLRLDDTEHLDRKANELSYIANLQAQFRKQCAEAEKSINQARGDVASQELRVQLEQMRLADIKKGPTATDVINASVNLANAQLLLDASQEELVSLEPLGPLGFISKDELQQKRFNVDDQVLKVSDAQIAQKKLYVPDKVKLAEQELKVHDAEKNRATAQARLDLLIRNLERDKASQTVSLEKEQIRLKKFEDNIAKTVYRSPIAGTVIYKKARWYPYEVGVDVADGWEVMSIPDYSKMKVVLAIDEARIASVSLGQNAQITPMDWSGVPFSGKVTRIAEKGRDEFELFADDTRQITADAHRQVFEVEVEIEGQSDCFLPGLRAKVEIVLNSIEGILLPRASIYQDSEGLPCIRVETKKGGIPEVRRIKVIQQNEYQTVVEGVKEGERVLVLPAGATNGTNGKSGEPEAQRK